jgi:O-antigen ligase
LKLVYVIFLVIALWLIQCLIGGTRLLFSLPSYSILACAAMLTLVSMRRSRPSPDLPCLAVTAIFFSYILARAAWSPVTYLWWTDFYMVLGCLVVYLLSALYVTHSRLRSYVIGALLLIAVVQVFMGVRQFNYGDNWMPFGFIRAENGRRASGMMISPIHFAGYLEAIGIVGLSMVFWSTWRVWVRVLTAFVTVLCYVGVALSGSRGGYLSSAFSLVVFASISLWALHRAAPYRFRGAAFATLIGFIALAGVAFFGIRQSADLSRRLDNLFGNREAAHDVRIYNWQAALDQYRVAPVFGTGAGTHLYYGRFFRRPQIQADPEHAHGDYLELLAEYGIIGLAGMTAFLFVHIANLFRASARNTETPLEDPFESCRENRLAIQIGVLSAIAAYLAHSVVDFNLHIPANALMFAFFFGIAANPQSLAAEPDAPLRPIRAFQLLLPALGAWILAAGFPKLPAEDLTEKARIAVRNREYFKAIEIGKRALEREQRNPFLYFHLGEAHRALANSQRLQTLRRPNFEAAVDFYRKGLQLFPQDIHLWVRLGQALDGLREFRDAEEAYLNALKIDPNLGAIHAYYAVHLQARGRNEEAERQHAIANRISSGTPYHEAVSSLPEPEEDSLK